MMASSERTHRSIFSGILRTHRITGDVRRRSNVRGQQGDRHAQDAELLLKGQDLLDQGLDERVRALVEACGAGHGVVLREERRVGGELQPKARLRSRLALAPLPRRRAGASDRRGCHGPGRPTQPLGSDRDRLPSSGLEHLSGLSQ